ncbi:hypothetical protein STEG23_037089 [Scotinomys teguina]
MDNSTTAKCTRSVNLFLALGGGKLKYQSTKPWMEDNLNHTDFSLLQDNVAFVLCLDIPGRSSHLRLQVSKPCQEGTIQHAFLCELDMVATHQFPDISFSMVHKKINLTDDVLAREHECLAIYRLPAFALSHLEATVQQHQGHTVLGGLQDSVEEHMDHRRTPNKGHLQPDREGDAPRHSSVDRQSRWSIAAPHRDSEIERMTVTPY